MAAVNVIVVVVVVSSAAARSTIVVVFVAAPSVVTGCHRQRLLLETLAIVIFYSHIPQNSCVRFSHFTRCFATLIGFSDNCLFIAQS